LLIYGRPPVPIRPVDFRPGGMTFDLWPPETVNEKLLSTQKFEQKIRTKGFIKKMKRNF
jgi:hypothetical protein